MIEQRSDEWFAQRCGKVTASRIDAKGRDLDKLLQYYKVEVITDLTPEQIKQATEMLS